MKILCATDGFLKSEAAIERASALADQLGADVTLLHVVVPGESGRVLEDSLTIAQVQLDSRVQAPQWRGRRRPAVDVRTGNPARIIVDAMKDTQADLLVLGPHRRRSLRDVLEGTIAQKALAARHSPVLIARDARRSPYRRVLLALDTSEASAAAVHAAESLMLAREAAMRIVHAHEPPYQGMLHFTGAGNKTRADYAESWKREAGRAMRFMLVQESTHPSRYDIHIEQRPAAMGIFAALDSFEPDLLVMGTRGGGRLHRALLGSVANRVLHEVECDTLIVPEGSAGGCRDKPVTDRWQPRGITDTPESTSRAR